MGLRGIGARGIKLSGRLGVIIRTVCEEVYSKGRVDLGIRIY